MIRIITLLTSALILSVTAGSLAQEIPALLDIDQPEATTSPIYEYDAWENYFKFQQSHFAREVPAPTWETLGPNTLDTLSGRVACLAIHPVNTEILYAGSASGGLWKSENRGLEWSPLMDEFPSLHISGVAIDPVNPNRIVIGTGPTSGVVTTTVQPGVGIFWSDDGGISWEESDFRFSIRNAVGVFDVVWSPLLPDLVLACTSIGLYISDDGGRTWQSRSPFRTFSIAIDPANSDRWLVSHDGIGIRVTSDRGASWSDVIDGLPSGSSTFRSEIAFCRDTPQVVYASMVSSTGFGSLGLYRSNDGGEKWEQIPDVPAYHCQPNNPAACTGWLFNTLGVSPTDPDLVLVGSVQFYRSDDGGNSWEWLDYAANGSSGSNAGLTYVDHWDIDFDPTNSSVVYVCNDGGVQRSDNAGKYWTRLANGFVNSQTYSVSIAPYDADIAIGGFHDHGLQRLDRSGDNQTWHRWSTNDGIKTIFHPSDRDLIFGNIQMGIPVKSTDGGRSNLNTVGITTGLQVLGPWISPFLMHPDSSNVFLLGMGDGINRTSNQGDLWQLVQPIAQTTISQMTYDLANAQFAYAHSFSGTSWQFWRSQDAGKTWQEINGNNMPTWGTTAIASDPSREGVIYVARNSTMANQDHLKVSYDYGNNWTDITQDLPDVGIYSLLVSPGDSNIIYVGTDVGLFVSIDGGDSYMEYNNNLPRARIMDIHFSDQDQRIYVATMGRGIWHTDELGSLSVGTNNVTFDIDVKIFPNPVSDYLQISLQSSKNVDIQIGIINSKGQRISPYHEYILRETDLFTLPLRNPVGQKITAGIYYLKIIADQTSKTFPFVVIN